MEKQYILFTCKQHTAVLEVNEIGHVFLEEIEGKPGLLAPDTSGMLCPKAMAIDEDCTESWTMLVVTDTF